MMKLEWTTGRRLGAVCVPTCAGLVLLAALTPGHGLEAAFVRAAALLGVVATGAVWFIVDLTIVRPVRRLTDAAATARTGRFERAIGSAASAEVRDLEETLAMVDRTVRETREAAEVTATELTEGIRACQGVLNRIEQGDPSARVEEDFENELVCGLVHSVNGAADGVASLVDDAHEVAIGLAEAFGVIGMMIAGDLSVRASDTSHVEIVGKLGGVLNQLGDQMLLLADQAKSIAAGDLRYRVDLSGDLSNAFNAMADALNGLVLRIRSGASDVASASTEILAASQRDAVAAAEQAAQISEVAAASRELAATARQVSERSRSIADSSNGSMGAVKAGLTVAEDAVAGMSGIQESVRATARQIEGLGQSSQTITEIVTLIEDIADKTTLLSLNAAIEAARAGEAGKGFAVVAEAIGTLAERTTKSTREISDLISGIQQQTSACVMSMEKSTAETERGAGLVQEAGNRLRQIEVAVSEVATAAEEISLSSQHQESASEEISSSMSSIDEAVKESAAAASQVAASAAQLSQLAVELKESARVFKLRQDAAVDVVLAAGSSVDGDVLSSQGTREADPAVRH
ncbi:MAG: methyl-accepting chemotaxis protein [Candidatus Eisenbacteria bacterium]